MTMVHIRVMEMTHVTGPRSRGILSNRTNDAVQTVLGGPHDYHDNRLERRRQPDPARPVVVTSKWPDAVASIAGATRDESQIPRPPTGIASSVERLRSSGFAMEFRSCSSVVAVQSSTRLPWP